MNDILRAVNANGTATPCALGVTNLWIAALCIVQDDDADEEIKLPHMNECYQYASAVISASSASDAHMGFLMDQPSENTIYGMIRTRNLFTHPRFGAVPCRIPFRTSRGITMWILDTQPSLYNHDAELINKRGWKSKESALAKRLMVFPGTGGLIARCDRGVQCFGEILGDPFHEEAGLGGRDVQIDVVEGVASDDKSDEIALNEQLNDLTVSGAEQIDGRQPETSEDSSGLLEQILQASWDYEQEMSRREVERLAISGEEETLEKEKPAKIGSAVDKWFSTVQDYTRRNLTNPGDIFLALGALAKGYHDTHGHVVGSYAAGLWRGTLVEGLMWHTSTQGHLHDGEPSMFSTDPGYHHHAPSWSWASCGRPVKFRIDREEPELVMRGKSEEPKWCCEVLDCVTTLRSELNRFGAVTGGHLDIKGMVLPIERTLEAEKRGGVYSRSRWQLSQTRVCAICIRTCSNRWSADDSHCLIT